MCEICSKFTTKNPRTMPMKSFLYFYCQLRTYFTPFSSVSIADFEQVNASWVQNKVPLYFNTCQYSPEN